MMIALHLIQEPETDCVGAAYGMYLNGRRQSTMDRF
jgi:hypothetical protein